MKLLYTPQFKRSLKKFTQEIRDKFYKQAEFLQTDFMHPSLHAKKYDEKHDIWQARVDKRVRFYFTIRGSTYILFNIREHQK